MPSFELREATPADRDQVEAFNARMAAAGQGYRLQVGESWFPTMWLQPGSSIKTESLFCFVQGVLRGAVVLKRMPFGLDGRTVEVAFYKYPLSEGIINPEYGMLAVMIQKAVLRRYPFMYGFGVGGLDRPVARLMTNSGWEVSSVPFHFGVFHPQTFLRNLVFVRNRRWRRWLLDLAALSGGGWFFIKGLDLLQRLRGRAPVQHPYRVEAVDSWDERADQIWERARPHYTLIGDRSPRAISSLYPAGHPHFRKILLTQRTGEPVGWAVVTAADVRGHRYFGNTRLGCLVDALAEPQHADAVIASALQTIAVAGADLVVVNHSENRWNSALRRAGLLGARTNMFLFLSPALKRAFSGAPEKTTGFYFTRGDGDGPLNFWHDPTVPDLQE